MKLWNAAVTYRPAAVVRCQTVDDVQAALDRAHTRDLPVSVCGGGHDWAGRAVRDGGLVIDLSGMRTVAVDGDVATAGGGATSADVMSAAEQHGYAAVTGTVGGVGMAGLALGGGYGPLAGLAGLAADRIVGAKMVLADGTVVDTDEQGRTDLLWALRGGGGNFGVVTELRLQLVPLTTVTAGTIVFGWEQAADVLIGWGALAPEVPDQLTVQTGTICQPDGTPVVFFNPTWSGTPAAGEPWLERLQRLGQPLMAAVGPTTPLTLLRRGDELFAPDDRHYAVRTRNLAELNPDVVAAFIKGAQARTSSLSAIALHHLHGAAARVPVEATAFAQRATHFMAEIIGAWRPGDGSADQHWATDVDHDLAPHALPGGYPNMLPPDADEQITHAYGPNLARLMEVKRSYDPHERFSATPLPRSG